MDNNRMYLIAIACLGDIGRKINKNINKDHIIFEDCNVFADKDFIWRGDIDFTSQQIEIIGLSFQLKKDLYLLADEHFHSIERVDFKHSYFYTNGRVLERMTEDELTIFYDDVLEA